MSAEIVKGCYAPVNIERNHIDVGCVWYSAKQVRKELGNHYLLGWPAAKKDGWRVRRVYVAVDKPKKRKS